MAAPHITRVTQGDIDAALSEVEKQCSVETANLLRIYIRLAQTLIGELDALREHIYRSIERGKKGGESAGRSGGVVRR